MIFLEMRIPNLESDPNKDSDLQSASSMVKGIWIQSGRVQSLDPTVIAGGSDRIKKTAD